MAKGQVFSIGDRQAKLVTTQSHTEQQSFALLNPNDGVVYLAIDRAATSALGGWDWKLPSQSYGLFPGPWSSLGLFYLDQSGAGIAGEFNLYDTDSRVQIPDIQAIGRALQARQNTLDITEGAQPPNPGAGVVRVWSPNDGSIHRLLPSGGDLQLSYADLSNVLYGQGYVAHIQLAASAGNTQASGISAPVNNWAVVSGAFAFSVDQPTSWVDIDVIYSGYLDNSAVAGAALVMLGLGIDEPGTAGSGVVTYWNIAAPAGSTWYFTAHFRHLAQFGAGSHSLRVDGFWQNGGGISCIPANGVLHQYKAMVIEHKR